MMTFGSGGAAAAAAAQRAGTMYGNTPLVYRVIDSFLRRRLLFFATFIILLSAVTGFALTRPRMYTASADTRIEAADDVSSLIDLDLPETTWVSPAQKNVDLFNDLLRDDLPDGFLASAFARAQLSRPISVDPHVQDRRFELFRKNVSVEVVSNNVFTVKLTWSDRAECERIVEALQAQYIEEIGVSRQSASAATFAFVDHAIADYEERLRKAESALVLYKQQNAGQVAEAFSAESQQLNALRIELSNLTIKAKDSQLREQTLSARLAQIKPQMVSERTLVPVFGKTSERLRQLTAQKTALLSEGYLPDSVLVRDVTARIKHLEAQSQTTTPAAGAGERVSETKLQDNPEYQTLTQQLADVRIAQKAQIARADLLRKQIAEYEARVARMPAADRELTNKMRDYTVLKGQLSDLLKRRESLRLQADVAKVAARSTFTPLGSIYGEATVTTQKTITMIAGGVALALAAGIGLLVLVERTDTSLRYGGDVPRWLGGDVRWLGSLLDAPTPGATHSPPSGSEPVFASVEEKSDEPSSLRIREAKIEGPGYFALLGQGVRIDSEIMDALDAKNEDRCFFIGITSALPGEGKTTLALQTAMGLARDTEKRICLLDFGLNGDAMRRRLGLEPLREAGIVDVLEGRSGILPILYLSSCDDLAVVLAENAPENPARTSDSPYIFPVLDTLGSLFDIVVVDMPAIELPYRTVLIKQMDLVTVVTRAYATPREHVRDAIDVVGRNRVLGVVLNRVRFFAPSWLRKRLLPDAG